MGPLATTLVGDNPAFGAVSISGGVGYTSIWCATARPMAQVGDQPAARAQRSAHECYIRGVKERITFQTNNGACWVHRRIIFSAKGLATTLMTTGAASPIYYQNGVNGMTRVISNHRGRPTETALFPILFRGVDAVDYNGALHAKIDTSRITLHYDRRFVIGSGNSNAVWRPRNFWHPINKTLVYNNDETASKENDSAVSVFAALGKAGIGDVIIVDIIDCAEPVTANTLLFNPSATLYWHER